MDLCEYEWTHSHFGLGFRDLMKLDMATFEEIESRVHKLAKEQADSMSKLNNAGTPEKSKGGNILSRGN